MNPYEVRLEVLKMARDLIERQYDSEQALIWDMVNKDELCSTEELRNALPQMPTASEIKAKAAELYEFVLDNK